MTASQIISGTLEPALEPGRPPVLTVPPPARAGWPERHAEAARAVAREHGSLLIRGLDLCEHSDFRVAGNALLGSLSIEREGFAPRDDHGGGLYSGTRWPADQPMCMHHELSYRTEFPELLAFGCVRAPEAGGETALADAADVFDALPADIRNPFSEHGWILTRNYGDLLGVDWRDAFGTSERTEVERRCAAAGIEFSWGPDDVLHTVQRMPAVRVDPNTGRRCWFNQVAFLNEWTMEPAVRDYLIAEFGREHGLPFTTYLGDGSPLDLETVDRINATYDAHTVSTPWRDGDLLLVDNTRTAHSRQPYRGDRTVVAMHGPLVHR
ncbi:TauD/TfdA family dioxygenase [Actinokineospora sp. NBRC 105648]|uniref:TauD/TfdA family dioxygenase n=1 Tax=Actinokineospora sp. NBRC 105648 TaxID=3032206 RepID=UPI0024A1BE49|nr:TauD/TfdA family dioxygenase [Actinokineospora sp. NBRC 105648]GLZ39380.1 protein AmbC [Actinokineospora sp. NBRC 105648]